MSPHAISGMKSRMKSMSFMGMKVVGGDEKVKGMCPDSVLTVS